MMVANYIPGETHPILWHLLGTCSILGTLKSLRHIFSKNFYNSGNYYREKDNIVFPAVKKKTLSPPAEIYINLKGRGWERLYRENGPWIIFLKKQKLMKETKSDLKEKEHTTPHHTSIVFLQAVNRYTLLKPLLSEGILRDPSRTSGCYTRRVTMIPTLPRSHPHHHTHQLSSAVIYCTTDQVSKTPF